MAITVNQEPNKVGAAYGHLLYAVSSNEYTQPQFQYVMDIVSGSTILSRVRQYPNPSGDAIFDPARIIADYLEYPNHEFTGSSPVENFLQVQQFQVKFGEEFGSSISGSTNIYTGTGAVGNPAKQGANTPLIVFPGQVDYQNLQNTGWNYDTGSGVYANEQWLTNYPSASLNPASQQVNTKRHIDYNDTGYLTLPVFTSLPNTYNVTYRLYNSSDTLVATGDTKSVTANNYSGISFPIGPSKVGFTQTNWDNSSYMKASSDYYDLYFYKDEEACYYDRFQIQFINRIGGLEWYGISLPTSQRSRVTRESYQKPFVNYSGVTVPFNKMKRGKDIYNVYKTDNISITTPYLDQAEAQWLEQIFDSPAVWINSGPASTDWKPVVVTDTSFDRNVNKRGQKLFQYTLNFEYSIQNIGR